MTRKTFGNSQPTSTPEQLVNQLYQLVGVKFPLYIRALNGKPVSLEYQSSWNEGGTIPVATLHSDNSVKMRYEENYTTNSLTADQIAIVEKWAADNIAT